MTAIATLPVLFATGTHGARPAASAVGKGGVYSCTTHNLLYQTDGSTWTTWATLGSTVATDPIWDAAGDLAVGSGADTAARLAIGAAGGAVSRVNGAVAWNSGTSFPSAATGDRYWRTDLRMEAFYDGTRWLTTQLFQQTMAGQDALIPFTATSTFFTPLWNGAFDIWVEKLYIVTAVITTNTGAAYWNVGVTRGPSNTSLGSFTTAADTVNVNTAHTVTVNALTGTTDLYVVAGYTKTGAPGSMYSHAAMTYRLVLT